MRNKNFKENKKSGMNTKMILALLAIALIITSVGIISIMNNDKEKQTAPATDKDLTPTEIKELVETFVQTNMFGAENAIITDVIDEGYVYVLEFNLDGTEDGELAKGFATKDGRFFLPAGYEMTPKQTTETTTNPETDLSGITISANKVNILYFWGDGCAYCKEMEKFLDELETKYPETLNINKFETWKNPDNVALMQEVSKNYNHNPQGVPLLFINNKVLIGASQEVFQTIEQEIIDCIGKQYECPLLI